MARNRFMTDLDFTKTQLAVFFTVLLLSVDEINPVKIIIHVFPAIRQWHVASLCVVLMAYVFLSEMKQVLHFGIKIFFHSILSIFFREVEVIGRENIPRFGPVIFTINHANQFIDAVMVFSTCEHRVSYLMAEASWKRRIIGDIAWALDVVPVRRAQDEAKPGTGKIFMRATDTVVKKDDGSDSAGGGAEIQVTGVGTVFLKELKHGDKIRPPGTACTFKVRAVKDDSNMTLDCTEVPEDFVMPSKDPVPFDILAKVDTHIVFEKVIDKLSGNSAVGIFPEGGSHDRTELLPLKVGIALIAYSALEKNGVNIPIVPVGLNYFRAHRWRGRAVVEYGRPIMIDPQTLSSFKAGGAEKRRVCNELLDDINFAMRSVLVSTPDYETLQIIHTARRLFSRSKAPLLSSERQDLSRRFAEGYKRLLLLTDGNPPKEWLDLQERTKSYRKELKDLGLRDYQVIALSGEHLDETLDVQHVDGDRFLSFMKLPYQILHLLFLLAVAAIPIVFLNLPVGILAGWYAERRRRTALAKSKVKVRGFDVMLTEKIMFCIVMLPSLWVLYGFSLYFLTDMEGPTIALIMAIMPLFAYTGIVVTEAGMVDWKDLRPFFMRLSPESRRRLAALPKIRKELQEDIRAFIKSIGPALGDIYYKKDLDWKAIVEASHDMVDDTNEEMKKVK